MYCTVIAAATVLFASEHGLRCAEEAVQIHGGYGYTKEFPVQRYWLDAKLGTIGAGTSEESQEDIPLSPDTQKHATTSKPDLTEELSVCSSSSDMSSTSAARTCFFIKRLHSFNPTCRLLTVSLLSLSLKEVVRKFILACPVSSDLLFEFLASNC